MMTKQELRNLITHATSQYTKPVYTYAESVDQEKRVKKALETRKKPVNLAQETWVEYLVALETGTYRPEYKPEVQEGLYDYSGL